MYGVVLAGGMGTRLHPLTKSINKHCLPIYDRPMIYYPIQSLVQAGISDIVLVTGGNHMSQFIDLLGDGSDLDCNISYVAQMQPGGIAEAISLVEHITRTEDICVILGDNIFKEDLSNAIMKFLNTIVKHNNVAYDKISLCQLMCYSVPAAEAINYGILTHKNDAEYELDYGQIYITEKPSFPLKNPDKMYNAVTGLYMYTCDVFNKIKNLKPSARGELEVSELNDMYASDGNCRYDITNESWIDCGVSIDHLLECSNMMKSIS